MSKKQKRLPGELRVSVVVTISVDPERENVGFFTTTFDTDGPKTVVELIQRAYDHGALNGGIDAFSDAVERVLSPPVTTVRPGSAGRA